MIHVKKKSNDKLIATIVVHVIGNYGSFVIDENVIWENKLGNILMFYSEVRHKVIPVIGYRETLTFKVFATKSMLQSLEIIKKSKVSKENLSRYRFFSKQVNL